MATVDINRIPPPSPPPAPFRTVQLRRIAQARSGDKGDASNVGVIARTPEAYRILLEQLSPERVKRHFAGICRGPVLRYEVPNLLALNFILKDSLGGGGTESLKNDAQGKTHGQIMLYIEVEVPESMPLIDEGPSA
jgi:hypothetical protein